MKKALDFLLHNRNVALATCEDNKPKIRIFQIMKQEGTSFYFATSPQKETWLQIQKNPHTEFIAMNGNISVRVVGKACLEINEKTAGLIYKENEVLHRFHSSYNTIAYFCINAEKIDYYDLGSNPVVMESHQI